MPVNTAFKSRCAPCLVALFVAVAGARADGVPPPAFSGAVGQGAAAVGGRGGDVYRVTNLKDYDSRQGEVEVVGSLRHAIESADGPRTIVFDVAGPLRLSRTLTIEKDRLTIAGQTSPGGVTLWGYPVELKGCKDVVIRFLRIRTGDFHARPLESSGDTPDAKAGEEVRDLDASSANGVDVASGCERVILDHLSVTWGMDETLSVTNSRDVTVQNCIIAESLNKSFHPKGEHGYGTLLRGTLTSRDQKMGIGGYTFFGDLWAHHKAAQSFHRWPTNIAARTAGVPARQNGRKLGQQRRVRLGLFGHVSQPVGKRAYQPDRQLLCQRPGNRVGLHFPRKRGGPDVRFPAGQLS